MIKVKYLIIDREKLKALREKIGVDELCSYLYLIDIALDNEGIINDVYNTTGIKKEVIDKLCENGLVFLSGANKENAYVYNALKKESKKSNGVKKRVVKNNVEASNEKVQALDNYLQAVQGLQNALDELTKRISSLESALQNMISGQGVIQNVIQNENLQVNSQVKKSQSKNNNSAENVIWDDVNNRFIIPETVLKKFQDTFGGVLNIEDEIRKAEAWYLSQPLSKRKKDLKRFLYNWLNKAEDIKTKNMVYNTKYNKQNVDSVIESWLTRDNFYKLMICKTIYEFAEIVYELTGKRSIDEIPSIERVLKNYIEYNKIDKKFSSVYEDLKQAYNMVFIKKNIDKYIEKYNGILDCSHLSVLAGKLYEVYKVQDLNKIQDLDEIISAWLAKNNLFSVDKEYAKQQLRNAYNSIVEGKLKIELGEKQKQNLTEVNKLISQVVKSF